MSVSTPTLGHHLPPSQKSMQRFARTAEPTLLEWAEVEPSSSEPHRWIGGFEHLERAIELDPTDHIALKKLVIVLLSEVDYATHELPYGYLGSASEDLATLSKAEALLPRLANEDDRAAYAADIAEERYAIHEYLRKQNRSAKSRPSGNFERRRCDAKRCTR